MKNKCSIIICALFFSLGWFGCSDDAYNSKYADPTTVSEVSMQKLFTGVMLGSNGYLMASYYRYFGHDSQFLASYSRTMGRPVGSSMYWPNYAAWSDNFFGNFYGQAKNFKKMEELYESLSDGDKVDNEAYLLAANVVIYDYLMATIDEYGHVPWTDACKVNLTGQVGDASASYDKDEDLYKMIIADLKEIGLRFGSGQLKQPALFNRSQDHINEGDMGKWQRYANSLRLRAACRVSSQGPLTSVGREAIAEIFGNPSMYPVVETLDQNICIENRRQDPIWQNPGQGMDADGSPTSWTLTAMGSGEMINLLQGDWRLKILFSKCHATNKEQLDGLPPSTYRGYGYFRTIDEQEAMSGWKSYSWVREYVYFFHNDNWDHQLYSSAETWFIKAEAYLQGWMGSADENAAKDAFIRAVRESLEFHFYYYNNGKPWRDKTTWSRPTHMTDDNSITDRSFFDDIPLNEQPDAAKMEQFAADKWVSPDYISKLDAIITQKWLNFGYVFIKEAWNEVRRTGLPSALVYPTAPAGGNIQEPPNRWRYPQSEMNYNKKYDEVRAYDTYTSKLCWALDNPYRK